MHLNSIELHTKKGEIKSKIKSKKGRERSKRFKLPCTTRNQYQKGQGNYIYIQKKMGRNTTSTTPAIDRFFFPPMYNDGTIHCAHTHTAIAIQLQLRETQSGLEYIENDSMVKGSLGDSRNCILLSFWGCWSSVYNIPLGQGGLDQNIDAILLHVTQIENKSCCCYSPSISNLWQRRLLLHFSNVLYKTSKGTGDVM